MNWNFVMHIGSAVATYVALMVAFLSGISPLAFALYSAVLLCLWLSFYAISTARTLVRKPAQKVEPIVPGLSESMAELHSLQDEINTLQAQFALQSNSHRIKPDDSAV